MNRKTALEQLEYWIEQYYRINGTPTLDDIKSQINLLKDYEREQLHIAHVVGRSEQLVCSCGSRLVKTTGGYNCGNAKCSV